MSKLRAIIIDDEKRARDVLISLLESFAYIEIVADCDGLEKGAQKIKQLDPDIVFLDVQMPNYAGYEIVEFIDKINFEIIFVTAFDQYAIKAFQLNATDYLVKPIDRKMLTKAIEKARDRISIQKDLSDYNRLLQTIKEKKFKQLVIPQLGNREVINLDHIVAIEADGAYSKIHMTTKNVITTSKNLKYFEGILVSNEHFIRTHRAWIINTAHLSAVNKTKQIASLADGLLEAKVSRIKLREFDTLHF